MKKSKTANNAYITIYNYVLKVCMNRKSGRKTQVLAVVNILGCKLMGTFYFL